MNDKTTETTDEDLHKLMDGVNVRNRPAPDAEARVFSAALAAFESQSSATQSVNWQPLAIAAATGLFALGLWWLPGTIVPAAAEPVGQIVFASGAYTLSRDDELPPPTDGDVKNLLAGTTLTTSPKARVLIELPDATTLRLDQASSAILKSDHEVFLATGRLYVDSQNSGDAIVVRTADSTITKVGTQFEVRKDNDGLNVAVREGQIQVITGATTVPAGARNGVGEELSFDSQLRLLTRKHVDSFDQDRWQWTQASRPTFDHFSGSLLDYLVWVARESGRELVFSSEDVRTWAEIDEIHQASDIEDLTDVLAVSKKHLLQLDSPPHQLVIGRRQQ